MSSSHPENFHQFSLIGRIGFCFRKAGYYTILAASTANYTPDVVKPFFGRRMTQKLFCTIYGSEVLSLEVSRQLWTTLYKTYLP
jgi:hypothetical protein